MSNLQISGVFPHLTLTSDLGPPRSECGVGALMPFADRLWVITYVSHTARTGSGTGLYEITPDLQMTRRAESRAGTYTNRMVHYQTNQLIMGPHVIDANHNVRTLDVLVDVRLCSTMRHLTEPERKVYMLGMEGEFFELDLLTLDCKQIFDLTVELGVPSHEKAHFKAGYSNYGRVIICNNSYEEVDYNGEEASGRLAEWDGKTWTILERSPFVEVIGRGNFNGTIFAMGWDRASAILKVFTQKDRTWRTYRLPKSSHTFDHAQ
jgi:hypothetical protein